METYVRGLDVQKSSEIVRAQDDSLYGHEKVWKSNT